MTRLPRRLRNRQRTVLAPEQLRVLLSRLPEPFRSLVLLFDCHGTSDRRVAGTALAPRRLRNRAAPRRTNGLRWAFDEPKSRHGARLIPLGLLGVELLSSRYAAARCDSAALVFSSGRGTVLDRHTHLSRQLKPAAKVLGFGNVNWHLLRRSNATLHDSIGTPLGTVQALLGHSSSEITRQVYLHWLTEDRRSAIMKLETLLMGPKSDRSLGIQQLLPERADAAGDNWSGR
jgi:hypothetical protein